jgi:hypothetical protein
MREAAAEVLDDEPDVADAPEQPDEGGEPEVRRRRTPAKEVVRERVSRPLADQRDADQRAVLDWLNAIAPQGPVKVRIERRAPRNGPNGENICGVLETVEDRIDEEYIGEQWGGGTFMIQSYLPNAKGGFAFGPARQLRLAGPPKMHGRVLAGEAPAAVAASPAGGDPLADRAITGFERIADQERRRADRLEQELRAGGGHDADTLKYLIESTNAQMQALREQATALQQQLIQQVTKPPSDPLRDRIFEQAVTGESKSLQEQQARYEQRLDKLRDDHATELRQLRQSHEDDVKRIESRHERSIAEVSKAHDREISSLKEAHARELRQLERGQDGASKALEIANGARVSSLEAENKRLGAELAATKTELATLRDKKDKTPAEQLSELAKLKENMDKLTGGGEEGDSPWYEKVASVLTPIASRVVDRLAPDDDDEEDADETPAAPPVVHPPVGTPRRNPADGMVYIHRGNGVYEGPFTDEQIRAAAANSSRRRARVAQQRAAQVALAQQQAAQQQASAEAQAAGVVQEGLAEPAQAEPAPAQLAPPTPTIARPNPAPSPRLVRIGARQGQPAQAAAPRARAGAPRGKPPTGDEVKLAVAFLEAAVPGGKKPDEVARSASALIPRHVMTYIRETGVDTFINAVASSKTGSPLSTQHGRTFVRDVAKFLFDGAT